MTLREQLFTYLQTWTATRMHHALDYCPSEEEHDACYLVNGFDSKMNMLQNLTNEVNHSTMMDIHYGGGIRNQFRYNTFTIYFNAREPDYTDAHGLASALDRAQTLCDAFIRDITKSHNEAKKTATRNLFFWMDVESLQYETEGPFGDGWETVTLYLPIVLPFDYCDPQKP